jgi:hypothetical protein
LYLCVSEPAGKGAALSCGILRCICLHILLICCAAAKRRLRDRTEETARQLAALANGHNFTTRTSYTRLLLFMTNDNSLIRSTFAAPAALRNLPTQDRMHRSPTRCLAYRSPGYGLSSLAIAAFGPATVFGGRRKREWERNRERTEQAQHARAWLSKDMLLNASPASRAGRVKCDTDVSLRRAPVRFLQAFETFSSEASSWTSCCESHHHGRTFGREPFFTIIVFCITTHKHLNATQRCSKNRRRTIACREEIGNVMIFNRQTSRATFDLHSSCCYPMEPPAAASPELSAPADMRTPALMTKG